MSIFLLYSILLHTLSAESPPEVTLVFIFFSWRMQMSVCLFKSLLFFNNIWLSHVFFITPCRTQAFLLHHVSNSTRLWKTPSVTLRVASHRARVESSGILPATHWACAGRLDRGVKRVLDVPSCGLSSSAAATQSVMQPPEHTAGLARNPVVYWLVVECVNVRWGSGGGKSDGRRGRTGEERWQARGAAEVTGDREEALHADLWSVCSVRQLPLCHAFHSFGSRFEFLNVAYCGGKRNAKGYRNK